MKTIKFESLESKNLAVDELYKTLKEPSANLKSLAFFSFLKLILSGEEFDDYWPFYSPQEEIGSVLLIDLVKKMNISKRVSVIDSNVYSILVSFGREPGCDVELDVNLVAEVVLMTGVDPYKVFDKMMKG